MSHAHKCQAAAFCTSAKHVQQGHGSRLPRWGKRGKIITGQESSEELFPRHRWCNNLECPHLLSRLYSLGFLASQSESSESFHEAKPHCVQFHYISSHTQEEHHWYFQEGPQTDPCPHLKWKTPQIHGDGAKRRDVSGDKRLVFTVVAAEIENLRGQKSKCCFYLCHCLTLPLGFIHLDIFEPGKSVTLQSPCLTHLHFYAVVFLYQT